ncbi:MAG TPA: type III-B CRISPR module RAMP protein Cmr1 [Thermoanaerobaculia bacterium]|jgi:CRISPR-associated protein Cmr1
MQQVRLSLRTVTPAFIGTAEEKAAEWSAKGVRGQLRWWFRAVAGGELGGNLAEVRRREQAIFGSTEVRSPLRVIAAQCRVVASEREKVPGEPLDARRLSEIWGDESEAVKRRLGMPGRGTNPLGYLGYGPILYENRELIYARAHVAPDTPLTLTLRWSSGDSSLFRRALWCWVNLGGIGARSRRGFGSLVDDGDAIDSAAKFRQLAFETLEEARQAKPVAAWTHFTSASRVLYSTQPFRSWELALQTAGAWMIAFRRRYGSPGDERRRARNRDYQWLKEEPAPSGIPDRAGFGLPLPFGGGKSVVWGDGDHDTRRASPLLIHVAKFAPSQYHLIFTHIPAQLAPDNENLSFRGRREPVTTRQMEIVSEFLDSVKRRLSEVK